MTDLSDNMRGALLMAAAMTAFTVNDAFMKALSDELPLFQALFLRGIGTVVFLAVMTQTMGQLRFRVARRDGWLIVLRSIAEVAAAWTFITALFNMPLANVSAILQSLPLTVTLASAVVFGETVGWKRMTAIVIGFLGVLMIVQPGGEGFNGYAVLALVSVACVTVRDLAARRMTRSVPSLMVALASAVAVTTFGGIGTAFAAWQPVGSTAALQLAGATASVIVGYVCSVAAMRVGEIGFVAPFRYTSLLVALVLGLVIFGTFPDALTLVGAAIVAATGLFTLYRERVTRRALLAARSGPGELAD